MADTETMMPDPGGAHAPEQDDEPTWRRWLPWIVLTAIILLVAWLLWMYTDWKTTPTDVSEVPGASVSVPDVVGLEADEARRIIEEVGLVPVENDTYDQYAAVGTVADQSPDGGTRVSPGSTVSIDVNSGDEGDAEDTETVEPDYLGEAKGMTSRSPKSIVKVTVPDLLGMSEAAAVSAVEARGLVARPMYQPRMNQRRRVIQQAPDPGELAPLGSQVHFLIIVSP